MKSSSSFLWELIHSLSSNERLFFKRNFSRAVPGGHLYIRLFDAISKQQVYDEKGILLKFSPALTKKNLASQKHYLQKIIGEAIIQYDSRDNADHDIYNQILLIRIYRKKGLLDEALSIWKKAVTRARKTESFALLNLLKTEFEKMIMLSSGHTKYDELYSIFKGHIITYNEYVEMVTLRDIYAEVLLLKKKVHFDLDNLLKKRVSALLKEVNASRYIDTTESFWYRHYYNMNKATLLYLLNESAEAYSIYNDTMSSWQSSTSFIESHGEHYIELLNMINNTGILQGKFTYVEECFNSPANELIKDKTQRANFEVIKYLALNKIYNKKAQYSVVEKLLDSMRLKYRNWERYLNNDLNRTVNISLGISCFVLEQYQDALYYIKRAIAYFKDGTREEQAAISNILLLLITYSLDNIKLFDAQYKSTYTYFYKRKKKHPFETAFVQCLNRTFYLTEASKSEEFRKTLGVFIANKDDLIQQKALNIFNYEGWLQSKIQRIPYRQYVEARVREVMSI